MVTFAQGKLPAVEWSSKRGKPKFEFVRRLLETDNDRLVKYLKAKGYKVVVENLDPTRTAQGNTRVFENPAAAVMGPPTQVNSDVKTTAGPRLARDLVD